MPQDHDRPEASSDHVMKPSNPLAKQRGVLNPLGAPVVSFVGSVAYTAVDRGMSGDLQERHVSLQRLGPGGRESESRMESGGEDGWKERGWKESEIESDGDSDQLHSSAWAILETVTDPH